MTLREQENLTQRCQENNLDLIDKTMELIMVYSWAKRQHATLYIDGNFKFFCVHFTTDLSNTSASLCE